jgi:uncharacterized membrane-anchored protein YhcB (DUF1043 family)
MKENVPQIRFWLYAIFMLLIGLIIGIYRHKKYKDKYHCIVSSSPDPDFQSLS